MENYLDQYVYAGGPMMVVLIPTSILALAWVFKGFIRLRRGRVMPDALIQAARRIQDEKAAKSFQELLVKQSSPLAHLASHLLRLNVVGDDPKSDEEENEFLRPALSDEIDRLWQETTGLATIYAVAPLMGLLGTVIGMIKTFREFTINPEHSVQSLSFGINQALVTTMWGLMIAIPAYVFVQIFRGRIFRYEKELLPGGAKELARVLWTKARRNESA
jgi:biopolymer transport protein ExbB